MEVIYKYFKNSNTGDVIMKQSFIPSEMKFIISFPDCYYDILNQPINNVPNLKGYVPISEKNITELEKKCYQFMKAKKITKNTDNRGEFNRAYKRYLERTGKIKCSYCPYNKIENFKNKHYGGFNNDDLKYPNWKLVSKKENNGWENQLNLNMNQ